MTRPEVCAPLIEFLRPAGNLVVEIGPGGGALTSALLDAGARVLAWEIDLRWVFALRERSGGGVLTPVAGDALELPWLKLPPTSLVAGNLPFNVATRIVLELLESSLERADPIRRAGFLLQREVVERLVAGPGSRTYGSLSVLVALLADIVRLGSVAPGAFSPPPKVDSAFVGLVPRAVPLSVERYALFKLLVRAAFAHRRKTLRNSLSSSLGRDRTMELLQSAGLDGSRRAESLPVESFVELLEHWEELGFVAPDGASGGVE